MSFHSQVSESATQEEALRHYALYVLVAKRHSHLAKIIQWRQGDIFLGQGRHMGNIKPKQ
jgi:hypothetical protein